MRTPIVALVLVAIGIAVVAVSRRQATAGQRIFDRLRPFDTYGHVYDPDNVEAMRPRVMGTRGVIASGHYLATEAGLEVLKAGGNAFDAGVAAAMTLKVTKMDYAGWNGVAPLIAYSAADQAVVTRIGAGTTPAAATLDYFLDHGKTPTNTALVPADVDVWLAALARYGTISFAEAARSALRRRRTRLPHAQDAEVAAGHADTGSPRVPVQRRVLVSARSRPTAGRRSDGQSRPRTAHPLHDDR